jgi:hypothetical protein
MVVVQGLAYVPTPLLIPTYIFGSQGLVMLKQTVSSFSDKTL